MCRAYLDFFKKYACFRSASNQLERARSKLGNRATWLGIVAADLKPEKNGSGISSSIPSPIFSASFC
jgi:hypothetical protein